MEGPQKLKDRTTIGSSNSTSGYIPEGNEISIWKVYLHSYFHGSIIHNSQEMGSIYMSTNG
jgi:hypothetical protein